MPTGRKPPTQTQTQTCSGVKTMKTMGLLHNLGDGRRHTARAVAAWRSLRRGEIFMTAISSPRRHPSPYGDTHRHMATPITIWRHPSPYGDTHHHMATPIAIWRHPSPYGDTHHHMATPIAIWRHPSPYGDRRRKGETAAIT